MWINSAISFRRCCLQDHGDKTKASSSSYSRNLLQSVRDMQAVCEMHGVYQNGFATAGKTKRQRRVVGMGSNLSEHDIRAIHYLGNVLQYINELGNHTIASANERGTTGYLLPVDCGHSGWPEKKILAAVTVCLGRAGFPIPAVEVPSFQFDDFFSYE